MEHLIIGYGYCGFHLARYLLAKQLSVTVVSRHLDNTFLLPGLNHLCHNIDEPFIWEKPDTIIYYLIPPIGDNKEDLGLKRFLESSHLDVSKVIYFGSSGVYGDHHGAWVDEYSPCYIYSARQQRRLDAEAQWLTFCQKKAIPAIILRIAGIYGPSRLPVESAIAQVPIVHPPSAPYTNHVYVEDLVSISFQLAAKINVSSIYNIADGNPAPLGTLQQEVAQILKLTHASYESWEAAWERASPMKKEFMQASRRLSIRALETSLGSSLTLTRLTQAITLSLQSQGLIT
ncbi:NAD-dependent epimerase/dehydratase family protein [Legionella brunensis]|uniref:NAD-dependent epimerase/dehydratase n=1 Tax=Legionella brunensis TaxID=29422 RepID=A0A0W0SDY5_9GAMM|nr:NAD-dependent epimerase/dehydratase family protein [Legionella brunensis]KTC81663.1 NAD-dependent epimerase/dehydratase [Legionella brunensis]